MKMIIAIINYDDAHDVIHSLVKSGFSVTKLSTSGGFLKAGNVTILVGLPEDKLDGAIEIIKEQSKSRIQTIPSSSELGLSFLPATPVEIAVGGATIFVMDVERFEKV